MNSVILSGRLVYEPEIKTVGEGKKKLATRLAVSRNDKNKTADFINAQAWNGTAEFIARYFHKGDPIEIAGKIRTDNYTKQDGSKAYETYVLISEAGFCLNKGASQEQPAEDAEPAAGQLPFEI